jgi:hypothetical protein
MQLPSSLLDTLLLLSVLWRLLAALPLGLLLLWLFLLVLRLSMLLLRLLWLFLSLSLLFLLLLWLSMFLRVVLARLLGLLLFLLALLLGLLWLFLLVLWLSVLLWLLLFLLGFVLLLLGECRTDGSERQEQDCCTEGCICLHWYSLSCRLGAGATNSCILLTNGNPPGFPAAREGAELYFTPPFAKQTSVMTRQVNLETD